MRLSTPRTHTQNSAQTNKCTSPEAYFPSIRINATTNLSDIYPAAKDYNAYEKFQCGGWSTTFDRATCGELKHPVSAGIPAGPILDAFKGMDAVLGTWIDWKMDAIRNVAGDNDRLITVGHNALLALLPSNNKLDFVSHHAYPSNPPDNASCTYSSLDNVSSLSNVLGIMQNVTSRPMPVTLGEFGTKTTQGLWPFYVDRYSASAEHSGGVRGAVSSAERKRTKDGAGEAECTLSSDCCAGIASTIGWFLEHGQSCSDAWSNGVIGNAGSGSIHHRCPTISQFGRVALGAGCSLSVVQVVYGAV